MADISGMVEFEMSDEPSATFPVGAGGPIMKIMRFFYPIPVHLLHMFTGPVSLYSFFHILRQARGENNMFKKQWDWLRTKKECNRCGGFEHEICPVCESRGSLPYESKFAQAMWTNVHNPELLEKADAEGKELADLVGGEAGKIVGRARGLKAHKDELNAEMAYSMSKFKVLGQKPGMLPCKACDGEGVIKCQGCHGDAKKIDNWPDIDYYMHGPGRAMDQWIMTNPYGQPVTDVEREFLANDPHTAKWWTLRKYLVEGHKEHLTPREKMEAAEEVEQFWWDETTRRAIVERRPGWRENLELMKKEDPAWVFNTWGVNRQLAQGPEEEEEINNDPLSLMENLQESPEVRKLRYMVMGPYTKQLEMYGLDPATGAKVRDVPKSSARKITEKFLDLYGDEADNWIDLRRTTNSFGLPKTATPLLQAVLFDVPKEMRRLKNEQRGDELAACMNHPTIVNQYAEYIAALESGDPDAAVELAGKMDKSIRELALAQSVEREEKRRKQREAGLARIAQFKQDDVDAGLAAVEAASEVVPEIVKQDPEVLAIEQSVKSIETARDAARDRLLALREPTSFFSREYEEWLQAWHDAKRYESLHTIRGAALVRKMEAIRKTTGVFPAAQDRAQVRLVMHEEDRLRHAEEKRLGRDLSREEFRNMLIEQWRGQILDKDALEKVYQDLGPDAEDVIFRMAVKERRDEQLEQAHREAGRLGEREDHYVALKSIESYELAEQYGWDGIKQLTYPTVQYALMDEKAATEEKERVHREAVEARRAKIAKRGQIGTRLAETFQPVTDGLGKTRRMIEGIIPKPRPKTDGKEQAAADVSKMDKRQEAKRQRELERARAAEKMRAKKEEKARAHNDRKASFEKSLDERFDGVLAFLDQKVFNPMEDFFTGRRKLPPSPELTASENARIAREAERARKASAKQAAKLPGVAAAAQRKIERAEARKRRAEEEFEAWKREFLAKPENRESAAAESVIEGRRQIVALEENWFASVKRRAEHAVQRAQVAEQLELDEQLVLEAETVREQLEREDLTVPEHVDVRRFLLEGTVRPDVLEAIFDKEPLFSRATPGDLLLDEAEREYDESVRNKIREQVEEVEKERETEMLAAEAPIRQTKEQMAKDLDSARRAFRIESKRPTLETSSNDDNQLWRQQWNKLGQDDWVSKTRTSLQLAFNTQENSQSQDSPRPVAFATLNPTLLSFGGPSWQWKK
ncbi:hypothetical protein KFL_007730020 [Klebsormidium nitens]|uniref:Uncharacterized protein n=1 Tax=Klebsormidium nitens TaxID=105231 RepID=A0A1Y1IKG4_KLENI|nr:hypothetical protein KFL_007730020 [Klebsormidium nitens]|eukprot:GAQ91365.1 hypothetical protein KFL_007730020 [Klebsormidium nitens]